MARSVWLGATLFVLLAAMAGCSGPGGAADAASAAIVTTTATAASAEASAGASEPDSPRYGTRPASSPDATQAPIASPTAAAAATCEVGGEAEGTTARIRGFSFPSGLSVTAGSAVTWTNLDRAPHTVTFDDGGCSSGPVRPGGSVTVIYTVPGSYPFHCLIHPVMTGTLEVTG